MIIRVIQDFNVFVHLPDFQDIHRANVIIPCLAYVYRVLGALINLQKYYLHREHQISEYPADEHL